jgi:hypothetical protein
MEIKSKMGGIIRSVFFFLTARVREPVQYKWNIVVVTVERPQND